MTTKTQTKQQLKTRLRDKAFGNTGIGDKEVASDYCNSVGKAGMKDMVEGTFLTRKTLERVMDCDENYNPQSETIRRIFIYFGLQAHITSVRIQSKYRNKPKTER